MAKKIVLILFFLFAFSFALDAAPRKAELKPQEAEPDQQMNDFSLQGLSQGGKKAWEVRGKSADILTDIVKLTSVNADVYGEEENINLVGDKGTYDKSTGKIHLQDNVVITTSGGGKLTTNYLDWDRESKRVSTEDVVNIQRQNIKAVAKGLEGDPDLKKVSLKDDVTVEIQEVLEETKGGDPLLSSKDPTIITCDGPLEIDYEKEIAIFNNNVKVDQKEQGVMHADKMEAYFDFKVKKILRIKSIGNVKIVKDGNTSYSDEALYSAADKKMTLTGRPRLVINSQEKLLDTASDNAPSGN